MSLSYANTIAAFAEGYREATTPSVAPASSSPAADMSEGADALQLLSPLNALAHSPEGQMPFSDFARLVPGDAVSTLGLTVRLMSQGWVEFVGAISETSNVRITPQGSALIETLSRSVAAA